MKLINSAIVAASAGGAAPTVFTLVLDDLSTRFIEDNTQPASIRFKLTATAGTTDWIYLDASGGIGNANNSLLTEGNIANNTEAALAALTGYSGKVTVSGVSSEAGDKYTFTITFDASLGAVTLSFDPSSQFYPTITLTEAVTQQGIATVAGVYEVVTIAASGSSDSTSDSNGNSVSLDIDGVYSGHVAASGWTAGTPGNPMSFTCDSYGPQGSSLASGNGSVTVNTTGVTPVSGQPEIHAITPMPVNPTGGTWKPKGSGSAINYNDNATAIQGQIGGGATWDPVGTTSPPTVSGTIDSGVVTVTAVSNGVVSDTALSPVNTSLTAPEITHSIT